MLCARIVLDSNGDHRLDFKDEIQVLRVDLAHGGEGTPLIGDDVRSAAMSLVAQPLGRKK